ncbi:MAG: hypothetical protein U5Q44_03600 [Dehalococcoidia bacterium]|nr:hypothetical protein [Dehalococcoidia bacterium]
MEEENITMGTRAKASFALRCFKISKPEISGSFKSNKMKAMLEASMLTSRKRSASWPDVNLVMLMSGFNTFLMAREPFPNRSHHRQSV